ncbi:LOW QUALITY PROTEIN: melanoma-associated antigen F1, partial [Glossophaga mutica]
TSLGPCRRSALGFPKTCCRTLRAGVSASLGQRRSVAAVTVRPRPPRRRRPRAPTSGRAPRRTLAPCGRRGCGARPLRERREGLGIQSLDRAQGLPSSESDSGGVGAVPVPIGRSEMAKNVMGDVKDFFPEIIARAAEHLWYVFSFELKQLGHEHHTYLTNKPKPLEEKDLGADGPRLGLLMVILGLSCIQDNRAKEAQVEVLSRLGVCPSKYHDPLSVKGLIREEFVQQTPRLQVVPHTYPPHTYPPECEFPWGPSNLEISKMKTWSSWPSSIKKESQHWPVQYCEALADEASSRARVRVRARASARAGPVPGEGRGEGGR